MSLTIALTTALIFLSGCATTPRESPPPVVDEKTYSQIEYDLGEAAEQQILQYFYLDSDPELNNRLRRVGRCLVPVTERGRTTYSFQVLDTREKNAYSLPNGRVLVTRGMMLRLQSEEELAAIVAHELAHLNHKHLLIQFERQENTLWQRVVVAGTVGLVPVAGQKLGYLLLDRGFDHQQELDADCTGADYLRRAGFDPYAMVAVMELLEQDPDVQKQKTFLSTHPGAKTRIQALHDCLTAQSQEPSLK